MRTDRTIPNNKLDITNRDNEKGTRTIIDGAISGENKANQERSREHSKKTKTLQQNFSSSGT